MVFSHSNRFGGKDKKVTHWSQHVSNVGLSWDRSLEERRDRHKLNRNAVSRFLRSVNDGTPVQKILAGAACKAGKHNNRSYMPDEQRHADVFRMNDPHADIRKTSGGKTSERCSETRSQRCAPAKHHHHGNSGNRAE